MNDGQIIVRVALEKGPRDTVTEGDWTDLTDRVRRYSDSRGRDDVLQPFGPGTAEVVLFNGDRMLDPSNPDGLLFNGADPIGLPLCPVQIGVIWDGTEYPKFTGYLGPEAWPGGTAPKGPSGTVTLNVMDAVGHSPELPGDVWGMVTAALHPDWWLRMDQQEFPILDNDSEVPSVFGGHATIEGTTGISRPQTFDNPKSLMGVLAPGLLLSGDHKLVSPAAEIMPDGDEDKFSVWLWWSARTAIDPGDESRVVEMVHPVSGIKRWSVVVDGDTGDALVTTFDTTETPVDSATISPPFGITRWDASAAAHMVTAVWDAGTANNLTVWFGGVSATLSIPGVLYESDLVVGPNPVDVVYDEITCWRRALDYTVDLVPVMLAFGNGGLWSDDTFIDRLGHFIETTGRTPDSDDIGQMHAEVSAVDGLWGLIRPAAPTIDAPTTTYTATLPATLADAYQQTVETFGGARWATKHDWLIRARTIGALEDGDFAEYYATPVLFTDKNDTLSTDEYRHAGVEVTGLRIDRVINDASVTYMYSEDGPPRTGTASEMTNRKIDEASVARYGRRTPSSDPIQSAWCDWMLNQYLADQLVERFAQPHQEIESIHLDPLGDSDDARALAEWLITTCDLEQACTVTYSSAAEDPDDPPLPVTVEGLNIQHIAWDWTPERWSVDLVAAKS